MHVATIRRRHGERVYESHLIRRSVREGKRVRHETIANVSKLPPAVLDALRRALAGQTLVSAGEAFEVERSLPHGHVAAVLAACRRLELGRLLEAGWLSKVYAITSRRAGPFPARIRDVGVTIDLATHDVDILSWVARERAVRVFAETARRLHADHEDLLFGLLHFPSSATGMLDVNWLTPAKRRQLVVVGEEGMFELDYLTQRLTFTKAPDVENPRLLGGFAPTFEGDVAELPVRNAEPLAAELEAFLSVVRSGGRPVVNAEDGLWAVAVANALLQSAAERQPIDLTELSERLPVR